MLVVLLDVFVVVVAARACDSAAELTVSPLLARVCARAGSGGGAHGAAAAGELDDRLARRIAAWLSNETETMTVRFSDLMTVPPLRAAALHAVGVTEAKITAVAAAAAARESRWPSRASPLPQQQPSSLPSSSSSPSPGSSLSSSAAASSLESSLTSSEAAASASASSASARAPENDALEAEGAQEEDKDGTRSEHHDRKRARIGSVRAEGTDRSGAAADGHCRLGAAGPPSRLHRRRHRLPRVVGPPAQS
jgi:hypothetical protein